MLQRALFAAIDARERRQQESPQVLHRIRTMLCIVYGNPTIPPPTLRRWFIESCREEIGILPQRRP